MKNIVIFGSGIHSKVLFFEIIKIKKYNIIGFIDNFCKEGEKIIEYKQKLYFNLGNVKSFIKKKNFGIARKNISGIVGIGSNYIRKKIVDEVFKLDKTFKWESIISKDCILNGDLIIGEGSLVMSGVVINTQTKIGKHCLINTSSSIDHDNNFDDYSSCGPGVVTGGNVTVGKNSYLGIGSVIKQGTIIGKNTVIGGNSFVNINCKDNMIYYGVPIKKIKKRKEKDSYL
jgi:sugar O-acyltransferase (sialic acid O-acetyltransferase NeuD family)